MEHIVERLNFLTAEGKRKARPRRLDWFQLYSKAGIIVKVESGTEATRAEGVPDNLKPLGDALLRGTAVVNADDFGFWWELPNQGGNEDPIAQARRWNYRNAKTPDEPYWIELAARFKRDVYFVLSVDSLLNETLQQVFYEQGCSADEVAEGREWLKQFERTDDNYGEYHSQGIHFYPDKSADDAIEIVSYVAYAKGGE